MGVGAYWPSRDYKWVMSEIRDLQAVIASFVSARQWEEFHTPKNLVMALCGEVGELAAEFQWLTAEESKGNCLSVRKRTAVEMEMADVTIYLLRLAEVLEVDLNRAIRTKLAVNYDRFPVEGEGGD